MSDFSTLYKQYAPAVHRYALYLSGQRADAEDITAETFARVSHSMRTYATRVKVLRDRLNRARSSSP